MIAPEFPVAFPALLAFPVEFPAFQQEQRNDASLQPLFRVALQYQQNVTRKKYTDTSSSNYRSSAKYDVVFIVQELYIHFLAEYLSTLRLASKNSFRKTSTRF